MTLERRALHTNTPRGSRRFAAVLAACAVVVAAVGLAVPAVLADAPPLEVSTVEYDGTARELVVQYSGASDAALPRIEVDGREIAASESTRSVVGASGTVVIAIEASSSTAGARLDQQLQYARSLVEGLPAGVAVGLTFFGDSIHEEAATTDRDVINQALANPPIGSAAVLYDGVASAADMLRSAPGPRSLVVLTFGWHFGSQGSRALSIEAARASGATVHTVAVGSDYDVTYLRELAGETGSFEVGADPARASALGQGASASVYRLRVPVDLSGGQHTLRVGAGAAAVERAFTSAQAVPAGTSSTASGGTAVTQAPEDASGGGGTSAMTLVLIGLIAAGAAFLGWRKFAGTTAVRGEFDSTSMDATPETAELPVSPSTMPTPSTISTISTISVTTSETVEPLAVPSLEATTGIETLEPESTSEDATLVAAPGASDEAWAVAHDETESVGADIEAVVPTPIRSEPLAEPVPAPTLEAEPTLASLIEVFEYTPDVEVESASVDELERAAGLEEPQAEELQPVTRGPSIGERASEVLASVRAQLAERLGGITLGRSRTTSNLRPGLASTVEARVRQALQRHALVVLYQPVCDGLTGTLVGGEALLRTEGILEVGATRNVVREASALGRMPEITALVIPEACRTAAALAAMGSTIPVSVNVSAEQVLDRDFMRVLTSALLEHSVPAGQLALEVAEHALIGNASAISVLHDASRLGVLIVVDDFWASTSELMGQLPPLHAVKIDVSHGSGSVRAEQELRRVVGAAHEAKVDVVAKRVESEEDRAFAASLGCELMQGNEFSRPVTSEEFVAMRTGVQVSPPTGGVAQSPAADDLERRQVA